MKKSIITLMFLVVATVAFSQTTKIKSYLGDSILAPKAYKQLTPIVITVAGDTARTYTWATGPIQRDSTAATYIIVTFYDKNANALTNRGLNISETAYTKWSTLFTAIDNYIHNQITRIVLH